MLTRGKCMMIIMKPRRLNNNVGWQNNMEFYVYIIIFGINQHNRLDCHINECGFDKFP